ncbi:hypothetical protein BpHYR1_041234 [Brachionus plicatilis]|uniref:Uncharacterized protein n=1 Tax=Brachionus plicatilis TaxID=10195 RepID=A0A3M7PLL1_BRAPC|nr:hypothetical protein BpHYR1_041234 [Brachionus plicatilis]
MSYLLLLTNLETKKTNFIVKFPFKRKIFTISIDSNQAIPRLSKYLFSENHNQSHFKHEQTLFSNMKKLSIQILKFIDSKKARDELRKIS